MNKFSNAKTAQRKANTRATLKGSLNMAIALLNKDFREDVVDYVISSAKANLNTNKQDLANVALYPKLTIIRRTVNNIFDTVELNTCYSIDHLNNDALKGHMQKSLDLTVQASGWTEQEILELKNDDQSAMSLTVKIAYALANPKEESLVEEGREALMIIASPFMESAGRMKQGFAEVNELAAEEMMKTPSDDLYVRHCGVVMLKTDVPAFERHATYTYLTEDLQLTATNAQAVTSEDGAHYALVNGMAELLTQLLANELSYDLYNQKVAEAIERDKKLNKLEQDILELEKQNKEGKLSDSDFATQISKLEKEAGL